MRTPFFLFLLVCALFGCSGSGSDEPIQAGLYSGSASYSDQMEQGGCLDFVRQCFSLFYQLQISQQYFPDGSSKLVVEHRYGTKLAEADPLSSSIQFSEGLGYQGPCGFVGGDVFCSGVREGSIESISSVDRLLQVQSLVKVTCTSDAGVFDCQIREDAQLQG